MCVFDTAVLKHLLVLFVDRLHTAPQRAEPPDAVVIACVVDLFRPPRRMSRYSRARARWLRPLRGKLGGNQLVVPQSTRPMSPRRLRLLAALKKMGVPLRLKRHPFPADEYIGEGRVLFRGVSTGDPDCEDLSAIVSVARWLLQRRGDPAGYERTVDLAVAIWIRTAASAEDGAECWPMRALTPPDQRARPVRSSRAPVRLRARRGR